MTIDTAETSAPEPPTIPVFGHTNMTNPDGTVWYHWWGEDADFAPPNLPLPTGVASHNCLPDDSGGSWYRDGFQEAFRVPQRGGETARIRKVGVHEGRDVYREDLDAEQIQPVVLPATSDEQRHAATFTATLWQYINQAGGPRPGHRHAVILRHRIPLEWLAELALPTRSEIPEGQSVTLGFSAPARYTDRAELTGAYRENPRTWVFENAHHNIAWLSLAASYLARLSGSKLEVLAAVFDSLAQDEAPGAHTDEWFSVIVQMDGAKTWTINPGDSQQQLTTHAGDVLLLPEGLVHATATPDEPGHSRHIQFSLCRHTIYSAMPLGMP